MQGGGTFGHFLTGVVGEFSKRVQGQGIKAALDWRDGPCGGIVGRYPAPKK